MSNLISTGLERYMNAILFLQDALSDDWENEPSKIGMTRWKNKYSGESLKLYHDPQTEDWKVILGDGEALAGSELGLDGLFGLISDQVEIKAVIKAFPKGANFVSRDGETTRFELDYRNRRFHLKLSNEGLWLYLVGSGMTIENSKVKGADQIVNLKYLLDYLLEYDKKVIPDR